MLVGSLLDNRREMGLTTNIYGIKFHGPPFLNKFLLYFLDTRSIVEFVNILWKYLSQFYTRAKYLQDHITNA